MSNLHRGLLEHLQAYDIRCVHFAAETGYSPFGPK
jgi:hypothetical protein